MRVIRGKWNTVGFGLLASVLVLTACEPEVEQREDPGEPFEVVFDPDEGVIPLPNHMALDDDGRIPEAATCEPGEFTAQGHFDDYLLSLNGWPAATDISLTFSAAPDMDTVDDHIQLWRRSGDEWERIEEVEFEYSDQDTDPCGEPFDAHVVTVQTAPGVIEHDQEYFAFATTDIEPADEGVDSLMPAEPMYLALLDVELVDDDGNSTSEMLSDEDAQALQQLRNAIAPAVEVIEEDTEFASDDLAAVWNWETTDDTFVVFEPELGDVPFPNEALMDEDGTVGLPEPGEADPTHELIASLNERMGFSASAPGWISIDGDVDEDTVGHNAVVLAEEQGADTEPMGEDDFDVTYSEDWERVMFEPTSPWATEQQHVGVVTRDIIGANGRPVQPTAPFVFLSSPDPLVDDGESTVAALDDETAMELEEARQDFALLFQLAPAILGTDREDIATAWVFTPEEPKDALEDYRDAVLDEWDGREDVAAMRACEVDEQLDCADDPHLLEPGDTMEHPNDPEVTVAMENVSAVYTGGELLSVPVDIETGEAGEEGQRVGVSVYLPEEDQGENACDGPYDVAIAQHGLGQDRHHSGVAMANELAAYPGCVATVAMDFPLHGGRVMGAETPNVHPPATPESSGQGFLTADFLASKAHFVQTIMDLIVLSETIQADIEVENGDSVGGLDLLFADLEDVDGPLFTDAIAYVGMSLGGVVGVPFAALDSAVESVALNGTGGRFSWLLEGDDEGVSELGAPILEALADDEEGPGIEPGDREFFEAMLFVQWLADRIDPFVFGQQAADDRDVLLQMVEDDRVIVNRATESLAAQLDVDLEDTTFEDVNHGFLYDVDDQSEDFEAGQCARFQAAAWIESSLIGEAELPDELSAEACLEDFGD